MIVKLGDVASYINGYAFKPCDWSNIGLPIIRIQDLTGNSYEANRYDGEYDKKYEIVAGDVLISWSASLGVYVWNGEKALLNQHIFKVIFDKLTVDKNFFVYQMEQILQRASSQAHGATMKHLTKSVFDNLSFYLPELNVQQEISKKLQSVNETITLHNELLCVHNEAIRSRFLEMFGDPNINPHNWENCTIGEIVTDVRYGTSRPSVDGGKYPYLRMNNLTADGYLDLNGLKYIDIPNNEIEKCIVRKGDVLFNRTNSIELVGKTCVFELDEEMVIAGYIIRVRLCERVLPKFFSIFMNTKAIKEQLRAMAKGAVNQANINAQELQSIKIYLPPIELQQEFIAFVEQVEKAKKAVQESLDNLEILKKSLMQKYFGTPSVG